MLAIVLKTVAGDMPDTQLEILWILVCSLMVLLMQPGFMCLEAGFVRQKNATSVALKNAADLCFVCLTYTFLGFGIMYGPSVLGIFGTPMSFSLDEASPQLQAYFFFQLVFCGTAVTIVSGAVAERVRLIGYCSIAVITAGVIYPIVGHWVWAGSAIATGNAGWLAQLGFVDHAGATSVHSVGGWMALAALVTIGQRTDYQSGQSPPPSNLPLSMIGLFLLWIGWFGFNAGNVSELQNVPIIIINTALAGAAGGILAGAYCWRTAKVFKVKMIINGVLAGLVASTAGVHLFTPFLSVVVGTGGGLVYVLGDNVIRRLGIDDTVDAVPVHLVSGIWGTLAIPLLAPEGSWGLGLSRFDLLGVQLLGIVSTGVFVFTVSLACLKLLHNHGLLRVDATEEITGLDAAELGVQNAMAELASQINQQIEKNDFSVPIEVEPHSEAAQMGYFYNMATSVLGEEKAKQELVMKHLEKMANYDQLTDLANRNLMQISIEHALKASRRTGLGGAVLYLDLDGFKSINDEMGHGIGDRVLIEVAQRLRAGLRDVDRIGRLGGDEFCVLLEGLHSPEEAVAVARGIVSTIGEPIVLDGRRFSTGASVGIAHFASRHDETLQSILQKADEAMYVAKRQGKSDYHVYTSTPDVA